jgi:hypothetical protein
MGLPELRMSFEDRAALAQELESNLKHGRAFIKDAVGIAALTDCRLYIVHPDDGAELALSAQAVMVCDSGPMRGLGIQLRPFDAQVLAQLQAFIAGERPAVAESDPESDPDPDPESDPESESDPEADPDPESDSEADPESDPEAESESESGADSDSVPSDQQKQPARHEQLRKLSQNEQQKVARHGDLNDRVMLERIYGKHVWEGLLHNPKLTVPEVARIARKGTMPRPLLEFIVDNNAWIQAPVVRRALLGNPRVSGEAILKLLRITPKHELRAIYKTTTYSAQVREAARKVLDL